MTELLLNKSHLGASDFQTGPESLEIKNVKNITSLYLNQGTDLIINSELLKNINRLSKEQLQLFFEQRLLMTSGFMPLLLSTLNATLVKLDEIPHTDTFRFQNYVSFVQALQQNINDENGNSTNTGISSEDNYISHAEQRDWFAKGLGLNIDQIYKKIAHPSISKYNEFLDYLTNDIKDPVLKGWAVAFLERHLFLEFRCYEEVLPEKFPDTFGSNRIDPGNNKKELVSEEYGIDSSLLKSKITMTQKGIFGNPYILYLSDHSEHDAKHFGQLFEPLVNIVSCEIKKNSTYLKKINDAIIRPFAEIKQGVFIEFGERFFNGVHPV